MNPVGTSSFVFVTLSGLFWGGWLVGSQTPQGQEALARAYASFAAETAQAETDLFDATALRALVCGSGASATGLGEKPCLAVAAAGRLFIVDAGYGAASALETHNVPLGRLEAVLLTGADSVRSADLNQLFVRSVGSERGDKPLPVYGPSESHEVVFGLNHALTAQGLGAGLQPWAPAPEPNAPVIVFEADGLRVSAFTTAEDAQSGRVGYRFDYRGRSLVVAGDGRAQWAHATAEADVVLNSAQTQALAQLHNGDAAEPLALAASDWNDSARMMVLTGLDPNPMIADIQVRRAREAGLRDVVAGRMGLLLELPLTSRDVNVRAL